VGAGKLLTAECARVIHLGVSSHRGGVAVKYDKIDSRSERKRRGLTRQWGRGDVLRNVIVEKVEN